MKFLLVFCYILITVKSGQSAPDKQKVLDYFWHISGSKTITGQANREPNSNPSNATIELYKITGKYPGLYGADFLYKGDDVRNRPIMIDEAKRQWESGSLVTLNLHVCTPKMQDDCEYRYVQERLSNSDWNCLIRSGCSLNTRWLRRLDVYANFLRQLQDAGVIVLFRPFHEMNGNWFWWNGRPGPNGSQKLFQLTRDYLNSRLNNIIWVWCVSDLADKYGSKFEDYYPGHNYADIVALDVYDEEHKQAKEDHYKRLLNIGGGKPIALGEVGQMPTPETLKDQPKWTYFLEWIEHLNNATWNTPESVRRTYDSDKTVKRGEVEVFGW